MNKIESTIQKMKLNPDYEKYFFQNASKYQNLYVWLEPLYKENYFKPQEDMRIFLSFLETVSLQNKEEERSETTKILLDIVNAFFEYRKEHKSYDYYTDYSIVKILLNLSKENITLEHIDLIHMLLKDSGGSGLLNSEIEKIVLPMLIENGMIEYILKLLRVIFDYDIQDKGKSYQEREPLLEKYWLNSLLEKHSKSIVEMIDIAGLEILISILEQVIEEDEAAFNNVWIASIEDHPQNSFPERYDNQLISFTRDLLEYLDADKVKSFVENFLDAEHPIFKRLAFHTINNKYDVLKELFWNWFDAYKDTIDTTFKHELYKLLEDRNGKFSEDEFEKLIAWIESLDYSKYYSGEQLESITAYKKKEWLWSIKASSTEAEELYEKYNVVNSSELGHPGFDHWTSGWTLKTGYESPIEEKDVFCNKTVDEIIQEIKTFDPSKKAKERFTRDSDLIEGLANDLADCVKEDPSKYSLKMEKFIELDWTYKYHLIYGLTNAWNEKKKFEWGKVFEFILKILDEDFFASEEQYVLWLKGQIASLIEYGTKSDENAFDKKYLPQAKEIIFLLLKHKEEEQIEYDNDMSTYVLNSINGKALHALINYALRYGRLNSSQKIKWEDDIKEFFTKQLDENTEYSKSIFTILGDYLPNLKFLDKEWVNNNFNRIFPIENDDLWEIAISGYFLYSSTVYTDIYEQLKQYGHIEKALKFKFRSDPAKRKVIQHICIMYNSSKDNKTIFDVIESKDQESILELIRFMWQVDRKNITEEARTKIFILWQNIYELLREDASNSAQAIFSTLSKWFVFIDTIDDEILPYLTLTVKYTEKNHNSYFIIEEFERLVQNSPKNVGSLYVEMLTNDIFPTYKQEQIENTIELLYKLGENDSAKMICNLYRKKGIYFLNEISKKYES
ncbi:hypothetical protein CVO_00480 [Sulfurimonas sp. CVO]|uniref:hypothetical protein n=1 Tax=Sulfurimonas sp. CVO TaxID=2283483 RepID=UPI00132F3E07|nr:hypothetical protein [Sulfurimonas sp. CVO]QHG90401.1 hypothetical protein CVO_00480 [Sulfurimonas sp. CVO]